MEKKKLVQSLRTVYFFFYSVVLYHIIYLRMSVSLNNRTLGLQTHPYAFQPLPSHQNRHKLERAQTIEFMAPVRYHIPFQYPAETYYRLFLPALAPSDPLFTLLSCHLAHPASTRSSSTTKSLIRNALANPVSNPHSNHPLRLSSVVNPNHTSANAAPAAHPTRTCLPV